MKIKNILFKKIFFKRILLLYLIIIFLFGTICFADDELEEFENLDENILNTSSNSTEEPETFSKHIVCMERTTSRILFEKNAYEKTPMASTTKILTGIIALERCELNEEVDISKKAATINGSTLGISSNTKMTVESLLYGLLLRSRK